MPTKTKTTPVVFLAQYSIKATWREETHIHANNNYSIEMNEKHLVMLTGKKAIIQMIQKKSYNVGIYDLKGRLCAQTDISQRTGKYTWQPVNGGMYLIQLMNRENVITKRYMVVK